jgi:hypothetical protein
MKLSAIAGEQQSNGKKMTTLDCCYCLYPEICTLQQVEKR